MDLVALDVDGTILDQDGVMTDAVREAVAALAATPTHVVVATGRTLHSTLPVLDRLGLTTGYAVCSNGAVTVRLDPELATGWEIDHIVTFDPAPVLHLLREHLPTALFAVEDVDPVLRVTGPFPDGELLEEIEVVSFEELLHRPAARVIVRSPDQTSQDFLDVTAALGLHGVNYAVGWSAWLDLAPDGVSKASGLDRVAGLLGARPDHSACAGDGRNDLEMFGWAGHAVAMGNASPDVAEHADEVCGTVHEDGLVPLLQRWLADAPTRS